MKELTKMIVPMSTDKWNEWLKQNKKYRKGSSTDIYQFPNGQIYRVSRAHFSGKTIYCQLINE